MARHSSRSTVPPSFISGRRGGLSVVDAMVEALWRSSNDAQWPCLTIPVLLDKISGRLGYEVPSSTVRSSLYTHTDIFEREQRSNKKVSYRLTAWARKQGS